MASLSSNTTKVCDQNMTDLDPCSFSEPSVQNHFFSKGIIATRASVCIVYNCGGYFPESEAKPALDRESTPAECISQKSLSSSLGTSDNIFNLLLSKYNREFSLVNHDRRVVEALLLRVDGDGFEYSKK